MTAAKKLSDQLERLVGDDDLQVPGLGVVVFKGGVEVFSKFIGRQTINPTKPVTRRTRFRAASLSKMFTAFTLMQLVERNQLNLDDDVSNYLGFELRNPLFPQKKITARMLASHTSSLRDGKIYCSPPAVDLQEFFRRDGKFWEGGAHFGNEPPEKFFCYCNLNYGVLGTLIERVVGKRFDIWQRENILAQLKTAADYVPNNLSAEELEHLGTLYQKKNPAGQWNESDDWFPQMDDQKFLSLVAAESITLQNPYVTSAYDSSEKIFPGDETSFSLTDYIVGTNASSLSPQGGLRISFDELANVLEMLLGSGTFRGKRILSRESFNEMLSPQWTYNDSNGDTCNGVMLSYGLGLYDVDGKSSARLCRDSVVNLVGHTGSAFGFLGGLFLIKNTDNGFAYMLNGEPVEKDIDPQSRGTFSSNYIWEEHVSDAICNFLNCSDI